MRKHAEQAFKTFPAPKGLDFDFSISTAPVSAIRVPLDSAADTGTLLCRHARGDHHQLKRGLVGEFVGGLTRGEAP